MTVCFPTSDDDVSRQLKTLSPLSLYDNKKRSTKSNLMRFFLPPISHPSEGNFLAYRLIIKSGGANNNNKDVGGDTQKKKK